MSLNRYLVPALVAVVLIATGAMARAETTTQSAAMAAKARADTLARSKAEQQMKARVNALVRQRTDAASKAKAEAVTNFNIRAETRARNQAAERAAELQAIIRANSARLPGLGHVPGQPRPQPQGRQGFALNHLHHEAGRLAASPLPHRAAPAMGHGR
jgi:hypothetical protein